MNRAATVPPSRDASFLEAAEFVATGVRRQRMKIASPEEIAWRMGYIDDNGLDRVITRLGKSTYGQYLRGLQRND
jgi:glucose-1-phosphate thymidylyltransferase